MRKYVDTRQYGIVPECVRTAFERAKTTAEPRSQSACALALRMGVAGAARATAHSYGCRCSG